MTNLTSEQFEMISEVMYEPLSYIHADYNVLASKEENIIWQKIANRQLIQQYKLINQLDCEIDIIVEKIFTHWISLPRCAVFLGYFYARETLLLSGDYYRLEPQLKAFLSLYPVLNINKNITLSLKDIPPTRIGYQLLFNFINSISTALSQRFTLLFSPQSSSTELPQSLFLSRSIFLLVLDYVALTS
ncbi:type III secretion protein [Proteus vulgaris]|jgi:type III secretion system OrgA/MxiK family protein|uniref:Type III secretion system protein n=1 Tax=Proteus vulgaris TaxID=585 RepID=A0A379F9Z1_PROVU|nr:MULTISPECIES: type III secretion protein [Proteus]NBN59130.1 type III secretion protein [Proteus sp. G2639]RNT23985.1 type III secretion protein [Proteus mirabilis]AYY82079.1 type III secretion protein [Proteus vulgaris]MBG5970258.1 type III secretion protein [Proteus vulgaris]MBG5985677.1 type III secretion protein [Proteus vulgaris]